MRRLQLERVKHTVTGNRSYNLIRGQDINSGRGNKGDAQIEQTGNSGCSSTGGGLWSNDHQVNTEVADETKITHEIQMEASGQIAIVVAEEFDLDVGGDCDVDINEANEEVSLSCKNLSQEGLSDGEIGGAGLLVEVIKTDIGDKWEYRATMVNSFFDIEEELEDNPFAEGMTTDLIIKSGSTGPWRCPER